MESKQKPSNQEIFNFISELLSTEDFRAAQNEFFEKNCHHFESEEENKHVYHEIFQEYSQILDATIEAKLQLEFPDLDFAQFFEDFEKNYRSYENQDTVEILFSFTDFDKFKSSMVLFNNDQQGKLDGKQSKQQKGHVDISNMEQKLEGFGIFQKYYDQDLKNWKHIQKGKNEFDVSIYSLPYENTGLDLIRVETIFQNVKVETVAKVLVNPDNEKLKSHPRVKEIRCVKDISENERIMLIRVNPPMLSQREMVVSFLRSEQGSVTKIQIKSVDIPEIPVTNEYVRADVYRGFQFEQIGNDVKISVIGYMDLKGYVPKMFMNMFMSKLISSAIRGKYQECLEAEKK